MRLSVIKYVTRHVQSRQYIRHLRLLLKNDRLQNRQTYNVKKRPSYKSGKKGTEATLLVTKATKEVQKRHFLLQKRHIRLQKRQIKLQKRHG